MAAMNTTRMMRLLSPRSQHLQVVRRSAIVRSASSTSAPPSSPTPIKARVLVQPDKFRPPSHSARLPRKNRPAFPGPPLSDNERTAQKTRAYPHMMPPDGSFMHWFLTSRLLHTWISLGILMSLTGYVILTNFLSTTIYKDQLPPNSFFSSHPFRFIKRYWEVYQMHTLHVSAETAERRRMNVDDVRKRSQYNAAHGIQERSGFLGLGGSVVGASESEVESEAVGGGVQAGLGADGRAMIAGTTSDHDAVPGAGIADAAGLVANADQRQAKKKWFGIW